jgi:hypothetical protein
VLKELLSVKQEVNIFCKPQAVVYRITFGLFSIKDSISFYCCPILALAKIIPGLDPYLPKIEQKKITDILLPCWVKH